MRGHNRLKHTSKPTFTELSITSVFEAGPALFIAGLWGAMFGAIASFGLGMFVLGPGAVYAATWGAPFGFCAGVIGTALGGRFGWPIGGLCAGAFEGWNLVLALNDSKGSLNDALSLFGQPGICMLVVPGIAGCLIGISVSESLRVSAGKSPFLWPPQMLLAGSRLYGVPKGARLGIALLQMIPVLVYLSGIAGHPLPAWFEFGK